MTGQLSPPVFHAGDHARDSVCDGGGGWGVWGRAGGLGAGEAQVSTPRLKVKKVKYCISKLCSTLKAFHFRQPEFQYISSLSYNGQSTVICMQMHN